MRLLLRPKRSWNVWPVTEARRRSVAAGEAKGGEFWPELMMGECGAAGETVLVGGLDDGEEVMEEDAGRSSSG